MYHTSRAEREKERRGKGEEARGKRKKGEKMRWNKENKDKRCLNKDIQWVFVEVVGTEGAGDSLL